MGGDAVLEVEEGGGFVASGFGASVLVGKRLDEELGAGVGGVIRIGGELDAARDAAYFDIETGEQEWRGGGQEGEGRGLAEVGLYLKELGGQGHEDDVGGASWGTELSPGLDIFRGQRSIGLGRDGEPLAGV